MSLGESYYKTKIVTNVNFQNGKEVTFYYKKFSIKKEYIGTQPAKFSYTLVEEKNFSLKTGNIYLQNSYDFTKMSPTLRKFLVTNITVNIPENSQLGEIIANYYCFEKRKTYNKAILTFLLKKNKNISEAINFAFSDIVKKSHSKWLEYNKQDFKLFLAT